MVTIDLPPDFGTGPAPIPPVRPGRAPLSPQRACRRERVLQQLVNPIPIGETAGLLEQQRMDIASAFRPRNEWQDWLVSTIATIMLRINRAERIERKLRDWASYRAFDFWEEDQTLAVETIAVKLAREPARVVAKLRETPAGIDWLLARWRLLANVEPPVWTDAQRELAIRLVGGDEGLNPTAPAFIAGQVAALEAHRERVVAADAIIRGLVEADLHDDGVPGLAKLRRYVRALQRELKWYVDQLHVEHPDRWDDPRRRPASDGPSREQWWPQHANHSEGKVEPTAVVATVAGPAPVAAPRLDETKPLRAGSAPENGETKPFCVGSAPKSSETKPFAPAPAAPSPRIEPPVLVPDDSREEGRHQRRPLKAGETSREDAQRQQAARRRSSLALAELI